ncbi:MAG: hypothetical protein JWP87_2488 [Labilithrix sp.]|nr:hypothetical protein [Labilithrix sp.]
MHPTPEKRSRIITREAIINLLTDDEVAKVSRAEDEGRLREGEEYVDLENPGAGIQKVQAATRINPHDVLPRSAVSDATWAKIVRTLAR